MGASYLPDRDSDGKAVQRAEQKPFADKHQHVFDGNGFTGNVTGSSTGNIDFTVTKTYDMSGVEILGAELGDKVQMQVLDDASGTYSTIPNYVLNQFGTNWYVRPDVFVKDLPYSARVMSGMVIRFIYENASTDAKDIYINLDLHEVIA